MKLRPIPRKLTVIVALLSLSLIATSLVWLVYSQTQNTLRTNDQWDSTKLSLNKDVMGAYEFYSEAPTLTYDSLNLGAWFGYQEVITKAPVNFETIDFDFTINQQSGYFYFIFNKTENSAYALRFSNNSEHTQSLFLMNNSGEFLSEQPMAFSSFDAKGWHHVRLVFDSTHQALAITLDKLPTTTMKTNFFPDGKFGFRGSNTQISIDNVMARNSAKKITFSDSFNFRNQLQLTNYFKIFAIIFFLYVNVFLFLTAIKVSTKNTLLSITTVTINLILIALIMELYLVFIFLPAYLNKDSLAFKIWSKATSPQEQLTSSRKDVAFKKIDTLLKESQNKQKVLFIGSSQTWGAGAQESADVFVKVVERLANQRHGKTFVFINAAINGSTSSELLNYYKLYWIASKPKLVVINLSNNDTDETIFNESLREFVALNKKNKIETVFILEAINSETKPNVLPMHEVMRQVARDENVLIIDLNQFLKTQSDKGIIWWDFVHLTSFGHQLAGEFIFKNLEELL